MKKHVLSSVRILARNLLFWYLQKNQCANSNYFLIPMSNENNLIITRTPEGEYKQFLLQLSYAQLVLLN